MGRWNGGHAPAGHGHGGPVYLAVSPGTASPHAAGPRCRYQHPWGGTCATAGGFIDAAPHGRAGGAARLVGWLSGTAISCELVPAFRMGSCSRHSEPGGPGGAVALCGCAFRRAPAQLP